MNNSFAGLNPEEQYVVRKCVKTLNRNRKDRCRISLILIGLLLFFAVAIPGSVSVESEISDLNMYRGSRPVFEDCEPEIAVKLFVYHKDTGLPDEENGIYVDTVFGHETLVELKDPAVYHYTELDLNRRLSPALWSDWLRDSYIRETDKYKEVMAEAEVLFEKELDRRESFAGSARLAFWLILLGIVGLYSLIAVAIYRSCSGRCHRRNELAELGLVEITRAAIVERDRFRTSGGSLYIMVETHEHVSKLMRVGMRQDNSCRSGLPCFLVSYPGLWGVYDESDVVWKEMLTPVRSMPHGVV